MSVWLIGDLVLLLGLAPCLRLVFCSKRLEDCVVALQLGGTITALALLLLAEAMHRPSFFDLALALALLSFPACLMFAYFIQRWLR